MESIDATFYKRRSFFGMLAKAGVTEPFENLEKRASCRWRRIKHASPGLRWRRDAHLSGTRNRFQRPVLREGFPKSFSIFPTSRRQGIWRSAHLAASEESSTLRPSSAGGGMHTFPEPETVSNGQSFVKGFQNPSPYFRPRGVREFGEARILPLAKNQARFARPPLAAGCTPLRNAKPFPKASPS